MVWKKTIAQLIGEPIINFLKSENPLKNYRAKDLSPRGLPVFITHIRINEYGPNKLRKIFPKKIAEIRIRDVLAGKTIKYKTFNRGLISEQKLEELMSVRQVDSITNTYVS